MKIKAVSSKKEVEESFGKEDLVYYVKGLIESKGGRVNLTVQTVDRDGEIVLVDGVKLPESRIVPLLDAHNSWGSVVDNVLGRVTDISREEVDGVKRIAGKDEYADTPRGRIAKVLVDGGFVTSVSIGFSVLDYDYDNGIIRESELYEVSLVAIPANPLATIDLGKQTETELEKVVKNYKDIKPKVKEYRATFLSDEFCDIVGYQKIGDELIDIVGVFESITKKLNEVKENPKPSVRKGRTPLLDVNKVKKLVEEEYLKKLQH